MIDYYAVQGMPQHMDSIPLARSNYVGQVDSEAYRMQRCIV